MFSKPKRKSNDCTAVQFCARAVVHCESCQMQLFPYHKQMKCSGSRPHITCKRCVTELVDKLGTSKITCPHRGCAENELQRVETVKMDYAHIVLDNSNFWIEGKKQASRNLKLKSKEDPRVRLDINRLTTVVAGNRDVVSKSLYGSEPWDKSMQSLWQKLGKLGWNTKISKRKRKEKAVDQQLVTDITKLVTDANTEKGTIIILCGDADVTPAVMTCLEQNWKCEVWMWKQAIAESLYSLQRRHSHLLNILHLDPYIGEITFTSSDFSLTKLDQMRHLKSQAAVLLDIEFNPDERWEKEMTKYLQWPFEFHKIGSGDQDLILVLVSSQDGVQGDKNAKDYFDTFFARLQRKYGNKVTSYVEYDQHRRKPIKGELSIKSSNRFVPLELERCLAEIASSDENISKYSNTTSRTYSPVYTPRSRSRDSSASSSRQMTSDYESTYTPSISRSPSVASIASSGFDEQLESTHVDVLSEASDEPKFTTYVRNKPAKSSIPLCRKKGECPYGTRCRYRHTEAEEKFFKNRKKNTLCWWIKQGCNGHGRCHYAHSQDEGFCRLCSEWGHFESDSCKGKGRRSRKK